jgi:vacuolar protein sorting-associated protein 13D
VEVKLVLLQVKLSVMTSSKLPAQLQSVKRKLGLTLIKFEDASVDLKPFVKNHSFESSKFFLHSILKHYKDVSSMTVTSRFRLLTHWHDGI